MVIDHAGSGLSSRRSSASRANVGGTPVTGGTPPGTPVWAVGRRRPPLDRSRDSQSGTGPDKPRRAATRHSCWTSAIMCMQRICGSATTRSATRPTTPARSPGFPISHRPARRPQTGWPTPPTNDAIYQIYDGVDGLWVSRADLGTALGNRAGIELSVQLPGRARGRFDASRIAAGGQCLRAGAMSRHLAGSPSDQRTGTVYAGWSDQFGVAVGPVDQQGPDVDHRSHTADPGDRRSG